MTEKSPAKVFVNALLDGYLDSKVQEDVIKMHAKESITMIKYANLNISNLNKSVITKAEFSETEIYPFHSHDIDCSDINNPSNNRLASLNRFKEKKIAFSDLQKLLTQSFAADDTGRRPYPSAGGLYPVEPLVFLFPERIEGFSKNRAGCYHFRPLSKQLQLVQALSVTDFYDKLLHGLFKAEQRPCFAILYLANTGKAIFKYRYRGYRHALMEAGSMYQQATLVADSMGLRNTVWSSFSEQQIMHLLRLDHSAYMPLTIQVFGYGDDNG